MSTLVVLKDFTSEDRTLVLDVGERIALIQKDEANSMLEVETPLGKRGWIPSSYARELSGASALKQMAIDTSKVRVSSPQKTFEAQTPTPAPQPIPIERKDEKVPEKKEKKRGFFTKKSKKADSVSSIGLPTMAKHEGHLGFSQQGFEAHNLPPKLQMLFTSLNDQLKSMGLKGITKNEAQFLLKTAISTLDLSDISDVTPPKTTEAEPTSSQDQDNDTSSLPTPQNNNNNNNDNPPPQRGGPPRGGRGGRGMRGGGQRGGRGGPPRGGGGGPPPNQQAPRAPTDNAPLPPQADTKKEDSSVATSTAGGRAGGGGWTIAGKNTKGATKSGVPVRLGNRNRESVHADMINFKKMREEIDKEKEMSISKDHEIEALRESLEKLREKNVELSTQLKSKHEEVTSIAEEKRYLAERIDDLETQLDTTKHELLSRSSDSMNDSASEASTRFEQELSNIQAKMDEKIRKLKEELNSERSQKEKAQTEVLETRSKYEEIAKRSDDQQIEIKLLNSKLSTLKEQIADERLKSDALAEEVAELKEDLKEKDSDSSNIDHVRKMYEAHIEKLQAEIEKLQEGGGDGNDSNGIESSFSVNSFDPPPPPPSALPPPPPPPSNTPPPPPSLGGFKIAKPSNPPPSSSPSPANSGNTRSAMLDSIKSGGTALRKVEIVEKPKIDENSVLGMLTRAIIDRRANMKEEEEEEDNDLLWA